MQGKGNSSTDKDIATIGKGNGYIYVTVYAETNHMLAM